jgi:hypothetical protein
MGAISAMFCTPRSTLSRHPEKTPYSLERRRLFQKDAVSSEKTASILKRRGLFQKDGVFSKKDGVFSEKTPSISKRGRLS